MNFVADLPQVEQPALAVAGRLLQPVDLMGFGGNRQHPVALPFDVEAQPLDVGLHAIEVFQPHRVELVDLVGPA